MRGKRRRAVAVACSLVVLAACSEKTNPANVVIRLVAYHPETLDVSVGTAVTWKQRDAGFHTVTSGTAQTDVSGTVATHPDGTFRSDRLAQGKEFSFAFSSAGTYRYFCEIHPATMRAQVKVS